MKNVTGSRTATDMGSKCNALIVAWGISHWKYICYIWFNKDVEVHKNTFILAKYSSYPECALCYKNIPSVQQREIIQQKLEDDR